MQYWIISRKLITNVYELRLSLSPALTVFKFTVTQDDKFRKGRTFMRCELQVGVIRDD